MKWCYSMLAILASVTLAGDSALYAQDGSASQSSKIAVIDMARIFQEHQGFQDRLDVIKADVKSFEQEINQQRTGIIEERDKLSQHKPGSLEYQKIEASITHQLASLKVRAELKRKEILDRESKNFYLTYREVQGQVQRIADQYGISLVLRYSSSEMDPLNRESVMKGISKAIVFQRNRDITEMVLNGLNPGNGRR